MSIGGIQTIAALAGLPYAGVAGYYGPKTAGCAGLLGIPQGVDFPFDMTFGVALSPTSRCGAVLDKTSEAFDLALQNTAGRVPADCTGLFSGLAMFAPGARQAVSLVCAASGTQSGTPPSGADSPIGAPPGGMRGGRRIGPAETAGRVAAIYEQLGLDLGRMWDEIEYAPIRSKGDLSPDMFPATQKMARAILEARAAELGMRPEQVTVVVAGIGNNIIEARLWVEAGAQVIIVEKYKETLDELDISAVGHLQNVRKFLSSDVQIPKGDIGAWMHPEVGPDDEPVDLFQYLKSDGLVIVQADWTREYICPYVSCPDPKYQVVFYRSADIKRQYFLPTRIFFLPSKPVGFLLFRH